MPAYNFKEQFADDVENLIKRQTIRPKRKRPTKIGDSLYLYTGMRTKKCRKLLETDCRDLKDIDIHFGGFCLDGHTVVVGSLNADRFAQSDGFRNSPQMIQWFGSTYDLPFKGEVIYW